MVEVHSSNIGGGKIMKTILIPNCHHFPGARKAAYIGDPICKCKKGCEIKGNKYFTVLRFIFIC